MFIQKPEGPTKYVDVNGKITPLLRNVFEDFSLDYLELAKFVAPKWNKSPSDFNIRAVYVVGSVLKGRDWSDLDLLMIADKTDWDFYRFSKQFLSKIYFNNRNKDQAIDFYVQPSDDKPENLRLDITSQLKPELDVLSELLGTLNRSMI